ncbi:MAG: C_GCAxxG_C_C family protein [Candidatus Aminicenantes bacterium]|nr:MAG: C_GCAxxG_C_C family protein [Candidatus Aminicenantes bacterium]
MKKSEVLIMPRREFIASASFLALGGQLFGTSPFLSQSTPAPQELKKELTPEELKIVGKSIMAKDLENYFAKGFSCAESLLMMSLKFLGQPEELVWIASGFGGGLYHKDLCGFLTSGVMAIGLSSGMLKKERKEGQEHCRQKLDQYWEWWSSTAPIHCSEIRKEDTGSKEDPEYKICRRIGQLAAVKIEELIKPAKAATFAS